MSIHLGSGRECQFWCGKLQQSSQLNSFSGSSNTPGVVTLLKDENSDCPLHPNKYLPQILQKEAILVRLQTGFKLAATIQESMSGNRDKPARRGMC